jgi:POT family proton-dependent oligopeptide transporter
MTAISTAAPTETLAEIGAFPASPDLFGHPRGLSVLFGTKLWDGISFYGMQALLTLYMAQQLLLPGHVDHVAGFAGFRAAIEAVTGPLSPDALAAQIFGLYVGAAYFTPIFGGAIADRLLGLRNTIALGALLMTAGHFCMAFDATFLLALALIIVGAGLMHGNVMSQVGRLYSIDDRRRADGFQIYYLAVNLSAFMAPLITGLLAQSYGWHTGFGFAGIGMLAGLVVYLWGARHLPPDPPRRRAASAAPVVPLTTGERRRVLLLIALVPVFSLFWMAQSQVWNVYNLWVRDHVDLVIAGWTMPIPWLQAIDGLSPAVLLPFGVGCGARRRRAAPNPMISARWRSVAWCLPAAPCGWHRRPWCFPAASRCCGRWVSICFRTPVGCFSCRSTWLFMRGWRRSG